MTLRGWLPVIVCAALAATRITSWSMWNDEVFTWRLVDVAWPRVWDLVVRDVHPPLYFLVAAALGKVHDSDLALRLPSFLATLGAIPVTRLAVRKLYGDRAGEVASWIVALTPVTLAMAVSARPYGMLFLGGALVLLAAAELCEGNPLRGMIGLSLAGAVTLYTHYGGAAIVGGVTLGALVAAPRRAWWTLAGAAGAAMLFLPWAAGPMQAQLTKTAEEAEPRSWDLLSFAWWSADTASPPFAWALLACEVVGVGMALRRRSPGDRLLLGVTVVGVAAAWVLSASPRADRTRNFLDLLPAAAALAALPLSRVAWSPFLVAGGAASAVVPMLLRPVSPQAGGLGHDIRREAAVVASLVPPREAIVLKVGGGRCYDRYEELAFTSEASPDALTIATAKDEEVKAAYPPECSFTTAFQWPLYAPVERCGDVLSAIDRVAGEGYPAFLLELGRRAKNDGDHVGAEALVLRALEVPPVHPSPGALLAEIRYHRKDWEGSLAAADEAARVARRYRHGGGLLNGALHWRVRALEKLGDKEAADETREVMACAKAHERPWRCGTLWE